MSEKKESISSNSKTPKKSSETKKTTPTKEKEKTTLIKDSVTKTKKKSSEVKIKKTPVVSIKKITEKKKEEKATVDPSPEKVLKEEIETNSTTKEANTPEKITKKEIPTVVSEKETELKEITKNNPVTSDLSIKKDLSSETSVIEEKDYTLLSEELLIAELQAIISEKPIQEIKEEVEKIKTEFNIKFNKELEKNKEEFLAEGKSIIDFYYTTPFKKEFDTTYYKYKDKRNKYYKNLTKDLKENLNNRLKLIEELKELFNEKGNTSTIFKHFRDIQERWFEAGSIPRDKYNTVWNNYHHHVENFYDILHLDREFRDRDFKNNLEQKLRLIGRAEELSQEENSNKAFRELQMLHKIWKEEIGPVAKEFRDEVWDKFSAATKIIHDKRHQQLEELEKKYEVNVTIKKKLIEEIDLISKNTKHSHKGWQQNIKKVQELRDQFFDTGRVPRSSNKEIWKLFKDATSNFNREKNTFYKNQKNEQFENLKKKRELLLIANENKDSDDFEVVTPLMKKIQNDWKNIGHIPRKYCDKVWNEFKTICNYYFDRLHSKKDEENKDELEHFELKKKILDSLESFKLKGDKKEDLLLIKEQITAWKKIGLVPYKKRTIEFQFNKKLDTLFDNLDLDKKERELIKFENKLNNLSSQEDDRKIRNEEFFITKKVGETKDEIRQLENNLLFFKHVADTNPLVLDVHKKINGQKEKLEVWKAKLKKIKALR